MLDPVNMVGHGRITRIFHKDQTNPQKQLKLKIAVENNSCFLKKILRDGS